MHAYLVEGIISDLVALLMTGPPPSGLGNTSSSIVGDTLGPWCHDSRAMHHMSPLTSSFSIVKHYSSMDTILVGIGESCEEPEWPIWSEASIVDPI